MSWFLESGGLSAGASVSASVLPRNIQGLFPLALTDLISLLSKGLSRVFSSTIIQKCQFFGAQPSLWSNSHIHTRLLEKHSFDYTKLSQQNDVSAFDTLSGFALLPWKGSFKFMAAIAVHSDSGAQENKICHCFPFYPSICHEVMGPDSIILVLGMLSFKSAFALSTFSLIKRLFSSSSPSAVEWYHLHI